MNFFYRSLLALLFIVSATALHAQSIEAHYSPIANFAYQLDCVSGAARTCAGREDYRAMWKRDLGVDTENNAALKQWAALRSEFQTSGSSARGPRNSEEASSPRDTVDYNKRVLVAALSSVTASDYANRIALLLPDRLAQDARASITALYPAFDKWWQTQGERVGSIEAKRMMTEIESPAMKQHVAEIFAFYGSPELARSPHRVALMMRPGIVETKSTSGENFGATSLIEFFAERSLTTAASERSQTPVIIHEYVHYVLNAVPSSEFRKLRASIAKAGGIAGTAMWNVFDEGFASALGNGRVTRTLVGAEKYAEFVQRPVSFYAVERIDTAGKALVSLADSYIGARKTIFDATFPAAYVAAIEPKLGNALRAPKNFMSEYAIIGDPALGAGSTSTDAWTKEFTSRSRWGYAQKCCDAEFATTFADHADVPRVIVIASSNTSTLASVLDISEEKIKALREAASANGASAAMLIAIPDGAQPQIVVLAKDASAVTRAAKQFAAMPTLKEDVQSVP